jgi:hypothetical protein
MLQGAQKNRYRKYGKDAAEEYLMGHTPTELVQKRAAEVEAILEAMAAPSPPTPPSPPSNDGRDSRKSPPQTQIDDGACSRQRPRLAIPAPSDADQDTPALPDTPPATTSQRKRPSSIEPVDPSLDRRVTKKRRACPTGRRLLGRQPDG